LGDPDDHASQEADKLCPSAPCTADAILLGRVGRDRRVRYLPYRMEVGETFVTEAAKGPRPETRFRFASSCVEGSCKQWKDGRCGIADLAVELLKDAVSEANPLPRCSIRLDCRWFAQNGPAACRSCPLVTTERGNSGA
jgi:hypothetical protein